MDDRRRSDDLPPILQAEDLAALLNYPPRRIAVLARQKKLPARMRPGGLDYYFLPDELAVALDVTLPQLSAMWARRHNGSGPKKTRPKKKTGSGHE